MIGHPTGPARGTYLPACRLRSGMKGDREMATSYARRVANAMARGFSLSQARGHALKDIGEPSITEIKETAERENKPIKEVIRHVVKSFKNIRRSTLKSGIEVTTQRFSKSRTVHRTYTVHTVQQYRDVLSHHRGKAYAVQINIYVKGEDKPYPIDPEYIRNRDTETVFLNVSDNLRNFASKYLKFQGRRDQSGVLGEEPSDPTPDIQLLLSDQSIDHLDIVFISKK